MPPTAFVTDTSLDALARRLRVLGYDVISHQGARLDEIIELARLDGRTVLTLSRRRPKGLNAVPLENVPREDLAAAVRSLAGRHEPAGVPFSRCALCNTALEPRHPMEAQGEIPGRVLRGLRSALYCPGCGKWYWRGSHVDRLCRWFTATLGRSVEWPHDREGAG